MASLTRAQAKVLAFIQKRIFETGIAPSFDEIAVGCRLSSKSVVSGHVDSLILRGAIRKMPGRSRSIELVGHHRHRKLIEVPAEPEDEDFEAAKALALKSAPDEDSYWVFWQAMMDRYQRES